MTRDEPVPPGSVTPCQQHPDWFFPEGRNAPLLTESAKHLCGGCDHLARCREWAVHHAVSGVWGGTTENERKREQRARGIVPESIILPPNRAAVYSAPQPRRDRQECGGGWGPIRRHEQAHEPLCGLCREFVNEYRARKREEARSPRPDACALAECDLCGKEMLPKSLPRHYRNAHPRAA